MIKKKMMLTAVPVMMLASSLLGACSDGKPAAPEPASPAPGATGSESAGKKTTGGFPIVDKPLTLSAMVLLSPAQPPNWNDILIWQEYEKMTGIHIDWQEYSSTDITEKRNLALASNQLPDMFYRTKMPDNDVDKYGAEGSFLKLNDLIDQHAPNFKKIMEKYPDVKKGIATADGSIYALPNLTDSPSIEITKKLFLNQDWLKRTGKPMPSTIDELYEVLKAFRQNDPNGNGQADEIPLTSDSLEDIILVLRGAYGLGNKGVGNGNWDTDPATGKLRFFPISNSYKELLVFLNKLYAEKLMDQEIFTNSGTKVLAKNGQNQVGGFSFSNIISRANTNANDYAGLDKALAGPSGERLFTSARGHLASKGAFMISRSNKHPEETMRWIDYFYSEEGIRMLYLGKEGVSYEKDAKGGYDFKPEIVNNIPSGSSFDQVVSKYVPYAGGSLPTLTLEDYFKGGETQPSAKDAAEKLRPFLPKELWAPFSFTKDEADEKQALEADINSLVNRRTAEFVQGKVSLNEFDKYVAQIEKMGLQRLQGIYEKAYARYQGK